MEKDFLIYIIYVSFMIVLLTVFFALLLKRKKNRKISNTTASEKIEWGSVSVFFDGRNNVTVIPYIKGKSGVGKPVENPRFLSAPYSPEKLGVTVRETMALCIKGIPCTTSELMAKLDFKDWKEFSKNRRNISIYYRKGVGIVFNTTTRMSDGAYKFNYNSHEKVVAEDVGNKELGSIILALLTRCR